MIVVVHSHFCSFDILGSMVFDSFELGSSHQRCSVKNVLLEIS